MNSYWEKRKAQRMFEYMEEAEDVALEIAKLYRKASMYTNNELSKIFKRFKAKHNLDESEAYRILNMMKDKTSLDELKIILKGGVSSEEKKHIIAMLEAPAYRARIVRLQELQREIDIMMNEIYNQEKEFNTNHYINLASESYYKSMYDIQHHTGYGFSFNTLDSKVFDRLLNSKWSGENYSEKIWKHTQSLAETLKRELLVSLMTGRTEKELADIIQNKFHVGAYEARRLVRTESNYISGEMEAMSYEECGAKTYLFIAVLDKKTCDCCRELDLKEFKLKDRKVGVNYPPMHPFCRSTTSIGINKEVLSKMERRARDPVTGKTYKVPANMSYKEWHDKYVKSDPKAMAAEKAYKYRHSDKEQFKRYSEVLGKEFVPDTFEKFQELKYINPEEWKDLKYKYRTVNRYKVDYGEVKPSTILELDKYAFEAKDLYMTRKAQKGNVASMKIDDEIFIASSQISETSDLTYSNYKGNKDNLILSPIDKRLTPHTKENPYVGHEDDYSRDIDTEYKFFEYIYDRVLKGQLKNKNITILSQKDMCFSCKSVYNELVNKKEIIDANININVVSGKRNDLWNYRNYKSIGLNNIKNKQKEKN